MKIPNPIKVQVDVNFNFNQKKPADRTSDQMVDLSDISLDNFRRNIHELILDELKELYGTEDWKQIFIDRAKEVHNYNVLLQVLTKFEYGDSMTENLFLLFLKEIYIQRKSLSLNFTETGEVKVN